MALNKRLMDVEAIKQTIRNTGGFRVHLKYGRTGTVTARMWHPDGFRVGSAGGGGYDKRGTALGEAMMLFFAEELKSVPLPKRDKSGRTVEGFYGLSEHNGKRYLDGACGIECMLKILKALGFDSVRTFETGKDSTMVLAERTKVSRSK